MKKFSIPGYFNYFNACKGLIEYRKVHPKFFYEDRIIDSSYDFPAGMIWNGGRVKFHTGYTPYDLDNIMQYYFNETDINLNHTCTNLLIDETLVWDWTCNQFIKMYYRPQDSVIVASKQLMEHLNMLCPNMKFIYSTTLNEVDIDLINNMTEREIIHVVNYNKNNDDEYLKSLTHPEWLEMICAEPCAMNCQKRKDHYISISEEQLGLFIDPTVSKENAKCPHMSENKNFTNIQKLPHAITNERIDQLADMGIQYFKISGRSIPVTQWVETMTYYLVKPEYLDTVRFDLLTSLW